MSKSNRRSLTERFEFRNSGTLWHDGARHTRSLGCQQCFYLSTCGGLQIEAGAFDCLTFCRCVDATNCDNVCPRNANHFVARYREVGGFDLNRVEHAPIIASPALPPVVPMIYHSSARCRAPLTSVVALSLYELIGKNDGKCRFASRSALLHHFRLSEHTAIILSGTDQDRAIERWWKISDREAVIDALVQLGVILITTPNFSVFDDVPRHDNLFNMVRIARTWSEMQRGGVACALHLNARTEVDWERWRDFLRNFPEIDTVAFEFGTGAGAGLRIAWHVAQLSRLAQNVGRPLHLIVRGGLTELKTLSQAFARVTFIDTSAFIRAQKRKRAILNDRRIRWVHAPTLVGAPVDDLVDENIQTVTAFVQQSTTALLSTYLVANPSGPSITNDACCETAK